MYKCKCIQRVQSSKKVSHHVSLRMRKKETRKIRCGGANPGEGYARSPDQGPEGLSTHALIITHVHKTANTLTHCPAPAQWSQSSQFKINSIQRRIALNRIALPLTVSSFLFVLLCCNEAVNNELKNIQKCFSRRFLYRCSSPCIKRTIPSHLATWRALCSGRRPHKELRSEHTVDPEYTLFQSSAD